MRRVCGHDRAVEAIASARKNVADDVVVGTASLLAIVLEDRLLLSIEDWISSSDYRDEVRKSGVMR